MDGSVKMVSSALDLFRARLWVNVSAVISRSMVARRQRSGELDVAALHLFQERLPAAQHRVQADVAPAHGVALRVRKKEA